MLKHTLMVWAVLGAMLSTPFVMYAEGFEQVVLAANLSGIPMLSIEISWGLDEHSHIRAGFPMGVENTAQTFSPALWGRALYLYNVNPQDAFSFYGGIGLSGALAYPEQTESIKPFFEFPFGVEFAVQRDFEILGEVRFGLVESGVSNADTLSLNFLSLMGGITYSLR